MENDGLKDRSGLIVALLWRMQYKKYEVSNNNVGSILFQDHVTGD